MLNLLLTIVLHELFEMVTLKWTTEGEYEYPGMKITGIQLF